MNKKILLEGESSYLERKRKGKLIYRIMVGFKEKGG